MRTVRRLVWGGVLVGCIGSVMLLLGAAVYASTGQDSAAVVATYGLTLIITGLGLMGLGLWMSRGTVDKDDEWRRLMRAVEGDDEQA